MIVCQKNLHYAQELQKGVHDKDVKPRSYASNDKIWLNSKYIKIKRNRKREPNFFRLFQVLHPVGKQTHKLKLPKRWKIHNVFYVLLLEYDITKKERVNKQMTELETGNSKAYEVEAI